MAIYSYNQTTSQYELKERPLYTALRVGTLSNMENELNYQYELTDHLGNVRALFSKKDDGSLSFDGARDYYPFGSAMPGRSWNETGTYRFGYQGQFAEDETYSIKYTDKDGKTQYKETGFHNFEARMYDSKNGRWLTTDPARQHWSPYLAMGNNPIRSVDPDGKAAHIVAGALIGGGLAAFYLYQEGNLEWSWAAASKIALGAGTGALIAAVPGAPLAAFGTGATGTIAGVSTTLIGNSCCRFNCSC